MAKKQKEVLDGSGEVLTEEEVEETKTVDDSKEEKRLAKAEQKALAKEEKEKNAKNKEKKKKGKGRLVKATKETMSELKKVTWPTFGDVVKKTGVVIAFVLIMGVFLYGINTLLGWLVGLLFS